MWTFSTCNLFRRKCYGWVCYPNVKEQENPCSKLTCNTHSCGNAKPFLFYKDLQMVVVPQKNTDKKNNLVPNGVIHLNAMDQGQQIVIESRIECLLKL